MSKQGKGRWWRYHFECLMWSSDTRLLFPEFTKGLLLMERHAEKDEGVYIRVWKHSWSPCRGVRHDQAAAWHVLGVTSLLQSKNLFETFPPEAAPSLTNDKNSLLLTWKLACSRLAHLVKMSTYLLTWKLSYSSQKTNLCRAPHFSYETQKLCLWS